MGSHCNLKASVIAKKKVTIDDIELRLSNLDLSISLGLLHALKNAASTQPRFDMFFKMWLSVGDIKQLKELCDDIYLSGVITLCMRNAYTGIDMAYKMEISQL